VTKPSKYLVEELHKAGVPCSYVQTYDKVFSDPQLLARNFFVDAPHAKVGKVRQIASAMHFSETPVQITRAGPLLGEDTADVLGEIGIDANEITRLSERGVVGVACVLS
ncbi:MAG: CoA transferase, partial [Vulcanimicrobiaceae bacterium]